MSPFSRQDLRTCLLDVEGGCHRRHPRSRNRIRRQEEIAARGPLYAAIMQAIRDNNPVCSSIHKKKSHAGRDNSAIS